MESVIQKERMCYICESPDVECHHVLHGTSNRKNAEKYGLKIWLCHYHHELVHRDRNLDLGLMRIGQQAFEKTHTRAEFMAVFGKNWL